MWILLLMLSVLGGAAATSSRQAGTLPRDVLPAGVTGAPMSTRRVEASSGTLYDVMQWAPNAQGLQYFTARVVGFANVWIGYLQNRDTNARRLFRAFASSELEKEKLMSDFQVTR